MNRNQRHGRTRNLKGRAKTAVGSLAGKSRLQASGVIDQILGRAEHRYGDARHALDDLVENGSSLVHHTAANGKRYSIEVVEQAERNKAATLLAIAGASLAVGWLLRKRRKAARRRSARG